MKTPKSLKIISQVLFVAITAAAVAGCGKSVDRMNGTMAVGSGGTEGLRGRNLGPCVDPIDESADSILSFSEMQKSAGSYELVGLQSVGTIQSAGGKSGIAVASMKKGENLKVECFDMSALPDVVFASKNETPETIDATNGGVSSNLQLAIRVDGPNATTGSDYSTASVERVQADCTQVNDMLPPGGVCTTDSVKVIKMADGQLGVLRIAEGRAQDGAITRNKTLAIYAVSRGTSGDTGSTAGNSPTTGSDDRGVPGTVTHPKGTRISVNGKKGKGSNANSDNSGNEGKTPCKTPTKNPEKVPGKAPCKKPAGQKPGSKKPDCKKPEGNKPDGKEPCPASTGKAPDSTPAPVPTTGTTSPIDAKIKVKTVTVSEQERETAKAKVKTTAEGDTKVKVYDKKKTADGDKNKTVAVQKTEADGSGVTKITHKTVTAEDNGLTSKTKTKLKIKKK